MIKPYLTLSFFGLLTFLHLAVARIEDVYTGEGSWLRIESDNIPFVIEKPRQDLIQVKFGDDENPEGKQSIAFYHGVSYVSVENAGGARFERSFEGDFCKIRIEDCECGEPFKKTTIFDQPNYQEPQVETYERPNSYTLSQKYVTNKPHKFRTTRSPYMQQSSSYYPSSPQYETSKQQYEETRYPTQQYFKQRTYPTKSNYNVYRRKVSLSPGHDLNVESAVKFDTYRSEPDCVNVVIEQPRDLNDDASYNNQIFRYFQAMINITNYSPEPVMIYRDNNNVRCNIGNVKRKYSKPKRRHRTRRPYTTSPAPTTEYFRPYVIERSLPSPSPSGYAYEGEVNLDSDYSIKFECSVPYEVYRSSQWEITITIGSDGVSRPQSYQNKRFGRYNIDCINYSNENFDLSTTGNKALCRVGEPRYGRETIQPMLTPGVRRRLFNLENDSTFEIVGLGEWDVQTRGNTFIITIGYPSKLEPTNSHSEFTFGRYTIIIENFLNEFYTLEQNDNRLECTIGMNTRQ